MTAEADFNQAEAHFQRLLAARANLALPTQSDFCSGPNQDAWYAWCDFGGLSLVAAYQKFIEVPESYQEGFMWMFPRAFEYYYPVVDRYLRTTCVSDKINHYNDGCQAWILGHCLESQFHWTDGSRPPDYVVAEIGELADFVRHNLHRYSTDLSEQQRIDACWAELQETLSAT